MFNGISTPYRSLNADSCLHLFNMLCTVLISRKPGVIPQFQWLRHYCKLWRHCTGYYCVASRVSCISWSLIEIHETICQRIIVFREIFLFLTEMLECVTEVVRQILLHRPMVVIYINKLATIVEGDPKAPF